MNWLIATGAALIIAAPAQAEESTITIKPNSDSSPVAWIVAGVGALAGPIAAIATARLTQKKSIFELQLEHATHIQERVQADMREWMQSQLAEKEAEIEELRKRCNALELKLSQLEQSRGKLESENKTLRQRYQRLLQGYRHCKAIVEGYRLNDG